MYIDVHVLHEMLQIQLLFLPLPLSLLLLMTTNLNWKTRVKKVDLKHTIFHSYYTCCI